ncbi:TetR family transcriptional regulator [Curtobacterium sp. MCPF17_047]|uniref:TetR family transcriptional regulator n=1 Tax=unclassified Curtobacterium TaxID=257496 RepID=UPI000DA9A1AF|nr:MULTISPECIES: TetR family transcriptional regulator [unclassified Curtobacterium]PZF64594.1 TetR family transcriptional regulator [Curtobacterium sp. MCPF17_047]WIB13379.1 TetR family transcriptional regulator [Curtobacterium sp. MCPF17_052]
MARWQPGTRQRLQGTALQLFLDRGFETTTVADIARAAQVTERTFFRHFADKREVLFAGQDDFLQMFVGPIQEAPAGTPPLELVARALAGAGAFFPEDRREWSRTRQRVIDAEPALGERELAKLSGLGARLAELLRDRGVPEPAATLVAQSGVTVFHLAFAQWISPGETRTMPDLATERLEALASTLGRQHA